MTNVEIPKILIEKIQSGNVALFLGAGASIPAGLPSGGSLTSSLKETFAECDQQVNEFMDVCQDIIDTPGYSRSELEDYITSKLNLVALTESHNKLCKYNWSAIFTTNFDTVIETIYSTNADRLKSCLPISSNNLSVNIADRSKIYLFKIMGTIYGENSSSMVLSRTDYNHSIIKRNQYLRLLQDYIKSGVILYIGYSFKDLIVKDIITEVTTLYGESKLPWSYMVLTELPTDRKFEYFLNKNRIIPIVGDFESFFATLSNVKQSEVLTKKTEPPKATLKIFGKDLRVSQNNFNMYSSCFEFIHEEKIRTNCTITDFLMGKPKCWDGYQNNWDFRRQAFNEKEKAISIHTVLQNEFLNFDADKNRILYITGMPGCGKTMFTFRIAYDYYKNGRGPVLFFNRNNKIDFKIIASFIEDINSQYDKFFDDKEKLHPIKPLLIFDDCAQSLQDLLRLKDFLISRGRACLIVANGRENEIEVSAKEIHLKIPALDHFILGETFTQQESSLIIDYLFKHRFITSKSERWENLINESYEKSIFATFYSLVHPSRKPLNEIIKDQFHTLTEEAKKLYLIICCFTQFDIQINIELLVRASDISYEEFYNILQDVKKIIFEEQDYNGNITYKAHHRIIAVKTIQFFVDSSKLFEHYSLILKSALVYNEKEKEIIEKFLIENFSKDSKTNFDLAQRSELFKLVCDNTPTRTLCHHLGLIEMERQQYPQAEKYLLDALDLPRENSESYRGESDQNILTSLGKLNSIEGLNLFRNNEIEEAYERFDIAERYFNDAKHGEYPNAYAYHANAYMWYQKARIENPNKFADQYAESISNSLQIINTAKDNLNNEELLPILELETLIWANFEDESHVKKFVDFIKTKYDSVNGYFIYASYYFQKGLKSNQFKELYFKNSLSSLNEALQHSPNDEKCLALKCKIEILMGNSNEKDMFDLLNSWYSVAKNENAFLLFNYARIAFINESYDIALDAFEELQNGIGLGNQNRSKVGNLILDPSSGEPKYFYGEVTDTFSKTDGRIKLKSSGSKIHLHFRPIAARFNVTIRSQVSFNIAFSYRGAIAVNIVKV